MPPEEYCSYPRPTVSPPTLGHGTAALLRLVLSFSLIISSLPSSRDTVITHPVRILYAQQELTACGFGKEEVEQRCPERAQM